MGFEGYGLFWAIIEELYNNANAMRTDYERIAFDMRTHPERIKEIVENYDLFVVNDGYFGSLSIEKRINERNEKSKKARISANLRWHNANASKKNANASKSDAISKGNKGNKERVASPTPPVVYSEIAIAGFKYISEQCPTVAKMKQPFTHEEIDRLVEEFGKEKFKEYATAMENYVPLLSKSKSANLTMRKWMERDRKVVQSKQSVNLSGQL